VAAHKLFDLAETPQPRGSAGRPLSCVSCGLFRNVLSPVMQPWGDGRAGLMVIGDAPGESDDRLGKPWQGREGVVLRGALSDAGVSLERDCVSTNVVNCRLPGTRAPTPHEVACCRVKVVSPAVAQRHPKVILLLGGSATSGVMGSLYPDADDRIGKWRGWAVPVPEWGCWLCPTFHPGYVAREEKHPEVRVIWEQDIRRAVAKLDDPVPKVEDLRSMVTILRTDDEVEAALARVRRRGSPVSFDYESTGLSALVQQLVCASFAQSPNRAYAFMFRDSERVRVAWRDFLADPGVGKISHNLSFEDKWSCVHFGVDDVRWVFDTMQGAHILDNRPGICGLKLQLFMVFGIKPYDTLISPYLKSIDERDLRAPNRIHEFIEKYGEDEALYYCGIDSLGALRLASRQMKQMKREL